MTKIEMKTQATPIPWILEHFSDGMPDRKSILGSDGCEIFRLRNVKDNDLIVANAELIVRAVNCHDELVKQVQEFVYTLKNGEANEYVEELENLLKRAKGEL